MIFALELILPLLGSLVDTLTKSSAPSTVTDALTSAISQLQIHKTDLVTKANLESQRG